MGLDSTVTLKSKRELTSNEFPPWANIKRDIYETDRDFPYLYTLSYFRKAWAVHDLMMAIDIPNNNSVDAGYERLEEFREGLIGFLKYPDYFDDRSQVFDMKSYMSNITQSILNCTWAIEYLKEHFDAVVEFSDSY